MRRRPAHELRLAVDCMPVHTRKAMLDAIPRSQIIVGAYTDRGGGVCPMLAAHRNGGRTNYAIFARAWDRYTRADKGARVASEREVRTLTTMLEASVAIEELRGLGDLGKAIADHRDAQIARARAEEHDPARKPRRRPTGERDRTRELSKRYGWAWLRPFRRLDDYEAALAELEQVSDQRELSEV